MASPFAGPPALCGPPRQMLAKQTCDGTKSIHDNATAADPGLRAGPIEEPTHFNPLGQPPQGRSRAGVAPGPSGQPLSRPVPLSAACGCRLGVRSRSGLAVPQASPLRHRPAQRRFGAAAGRCAGSG